MKKTIQTLAAVSVLTMGMTAFAAEEEGAPSMPQATQTQPAMKVDAKIHKLFVKLDKNKDGYIDKSEAKSNKALFKTYGSISQAGKLDEAEFAAWEQSREKTKK